MGTSIDHHYYPSLIGCLQLTTDGKSLTALRLVGESSDRPEAGKATSAVIQEACRQLDEYFAGTRRTFDLPLAPQGTVFQRKVWDELQQIPYGTTVSYAQVARSIGSPKACRAVGSANGKNPVAIIIPCHRVINADGKLGGYAYGLEVKKQLLRLERAL
jgi:methylated-DNA-[protein]-cysteine S-methyltransferase